LNGARVIGFAARQAPRLFPCAVRCAFRPAVPLSELSGSFPRARDPLQSSFALTPAHSLSGSGCLPGSPPSSRHHRVRPLDSRASQVLDTFRPQAFSTSRRLSRTPASRACFIPQPPPGTFRSFRGLPSPRSRRFPHRKRAAPLPLFAGRSPEQVWSPRSGALDFEALIRAELVPRMVGS